MYELVILIAVLVVLGLQIFIVSKKKYQGPRGFEGVAGVPGPTGAQGVSGPVGKCCLEDDEKAFTEYCEALESIFGDKTAVLWPRSFLELNDEDFETLVSKLHKFAPSLSTQLKTMRQQQTDIRARQDIIRENRNKVYDPDEVREQARRDVGSFYAGQGEPLPYRLYIPTWPPADDPLIGYALIPENRIKKKKKKRK